MKQESAVKLVYHHTGIAVKSISDSLDHYAKIFGSGNVSEAVSIDSQKVRVAFVKNATDGYLELVEPLSEDSPISNLLNKRVSYYHIGYKVKNLIEAISFMETLNFKALSIFKSEAFAGKNCVFLFSPEAHLIELIEE